MPRRARNCCVEGAALKVLTILGTRPEIIRLSRVIPRLDDGATHTLVHTGQNFDATLSADVFRDLRVREPDHYLGVGATANLGEQLGQVIQKSFELMVAERPDRVLLLGDTNSALAAIPAKRLGIPVFHMEAGNRCYDDRVPEEVNRRIIDHSSDVLMPYTRQSREHLLREGIAESRIVVTGNPILEVMLHHQSQIDASRALEELGLTPRQYLLVTLHRAENVDEPARLAAAIESLARLHARHRVPVVLSTHPRTRHRLQQAGIPEPAGVRFLPPFGFFDFIALERAALCVLTDSGTVQEECCILKVPNVTLRDVTERPETLECGSNMLAGVDPDVVMRCVETALASPPHWTPPAEYLATDVSRVASGIVLGPYPLRGPA